MQTITAEQCWIKTSPAGKRKMQLSIQINVIKDTGPISILQVHTQIRTFWSIVHAVCRHDFHPAFKKFTTPLGVIISHHL